MSSDTTWPQRRMRRRIGFAILSLAVLFALASAGPILYGGREKVQVCDDRGVPAGGTDPIGPASNLDYWPVGVDCLWFAEDGSTITQTSGDWGSTLMFWSVLPLLAGGAALVLFSRRSTAEHWVALRSDG